MKRIEDYLDGIKRIAITGHTSPDGDCAGSCLGLWNYLKDNYPDITAHVYLQEIKSAFDFLRGVDEIRHEDTGEDYDLMMRLYSQGLTGENLDESLYFIRMDEDTYRRRQYKFRINEVRVKWRGFSRLGLFPKGVPYALKPLAVGLMPKGPLDRLKAAYYKDR